MDGTDGSSARKRHHEQDGQLLDKKTRGALAELNRRDHSDGQGSTALHRAVMENDVAGVTRLLKSGAALDKLDSDCKSPLFYAVEYNYEDSVKQLLKAGANPIKSRKSTSPEIKDLLFQWESVKPTKKSNKSRLHRAAERGFTDVVKMLLDVVDVNQQDEDGKTPMHYAAGGEHLPIIDLLLQHKADEMLIDQNAATPLHSAARSNSCDAVKMLLNYNPGLLTMTDINNETAIHIAARYGHVDLLVDLLVRLNCTALNAAAGGKHLLHIAAENAQDIAVNRILSHFKDDIDKQDTMGCTPLHLAVRKHSPSNQAVVVKLLEWEADANVKDHDGNTPLHTVVKRCFDRVNHQLLLMIHHLVDGDADPEVPDKDGRTCIDLVKLLPDGRQKKNVVAALFTKPPNSKLLPEVEWYRCLGRQGRNLLGLIRKHPREERPSNSYAFWPMDKVDDQFAKELLCEARVYPMTAKPRGRAVLINITKFPGRNRERTGTDVDVKRLRNLFTCLGFDVMFWEELSSKALKRKIEIEKKDSIHQSANAFVFIIMTHGGPGYIECGDGEKLQIQEDIVKQFNGTNWPIFNHKPKIFFIQACRGTDKEAPSMSLSPPVIETDASLQEAMPTTKPNETRPNSDMMIIFSTYVGCKAARAVKSRYAPAEGAWFIEEFTLMAELFAHEDDLDEIVKKANQLLGHRKSLDSGSVQTANVDSTLTRRLYFLPRYFENSGN